MKFKHILLFLAFSLPSLLFSQPITTGSKYGTDSINCVKNMSLYMEYFKHKNYNDAIGYWRKVYESCPKAHVSIYIDGSKMYKNFISQTKDTVLQNRWTDTLMTIYDKRILYFGQEGFVLGRKGFDYLRFRKKGAPMAYLLLAKSIELEKNTAEAATLVAFMDASSDLVKQERLKKQEIINNYFTVKEIAEYNIKEDGGNKEIYQNALEEIEKIASKYLDCKELENAYKIKYQADETLLPEALKVLKNSNCTNSEFYYTLLTKSVEKNPDNKALAIQLAELSLNKKDYDNSKKYCLLSLELVGKESAPDLNEKADCLYNLARALYGKGHYSEAKKIIKDVIDINPNNGLPYILLGDMYAASTSCGDNEFQNKAVYWLAVDMYTKAKEVDANTASMASIYKMKLATYSKYFPTKEEAFFNGYQSGQSYAIGCWINETTTVRVK